MSVFLPSLKASGHLDEIKMTVFNVGSRKVNPEDDYGSKGWGIFAPNLSIYGFDADEDACNAANAEIENRQVPWLEKHIPICLSNKQGKSTLYLTNHRPCTSLFLPNESFLKRLVQYSSKVMTIDFTVEIETTTLDSFCTSEAIESVDFIQIDVQGANLLVLQGAESLLKRSVYAIQIEVEFSPLYLNQPLFADVDSFLRARDFSLFDLDSYYSQRTRSPIHTSIHPGQLIWSDAFYLRDFLISEPQTISPEKIFKLACVADVMNFTDYALELLEYLTVNYGSDPKYNFANSILEVFSQFPDLINQGLESLPIVANIRPYLK